MLKTIMRMCVAGLVLCSTALSAANPSPQTDALITEIVKRTPAFTGAVYYQNGEHDNALYFGDTSPTSGKAIGPNTNFAIASLSKHITSFLAIELIQQGKLELGSKLKDIFDLTIDDANIRNVQVLQLMHHTAGFHQQPCTVREDINKMLACADVDTDSIGTFSYSNFGYLVLGKIIEKITGKSYGEVFTERVLEPLGLKGSGYVRNDQTATGTIKTWLGVIPTDDFKHHTVVYNPKELADGGLYFTLPDFVKWLKYLRDDPRTQGYRDLLNETKDYRYGWNHLDQLSMEWHNGAIDGFRSNAYWSTESMVVVLQNTDRATPAELDLTIFSAVHGGCETAEKCLELFSPDDRQDWTTYVTRTVYMLGIPFVAWLVILGAFNQWQWRAPDRTPLVMTAIAGTIVSAIFSIWRQEYSLLVGAVLLLGGTAVWRWKSLPQSEAKAKDIISSFIGLLIASWTLWNLVAGHPN